jgi:hypothetical protein
MLRIQTSFQDTPGDGYYFVLLYEGRNLSDQINDLGLKDGDIVLLWEPDCEGYTIKARLLFNHRHGMMSEARLWAKEISN